MNFFFCNYTIIHIGIHVLCECAKFKTKLFLWKAWGPVQMSRLPYPSAANGVTTITLYTLDLLDHVVDTDVANVFYHLLDYWTRFVLVVGGHLKRRVDRVRGTTVDRSHRVARRQRIASGASHIAAWWSGAASGRVCFLQSRRRSSLVRSWKSIGTRWFSPLNVWFIVCVYIYEIILIAYITYL